MMLDMTLSETEKNQHFQEEDLKELSDNDLVKIIKERDSELFGIMIERYQGKLFAYLYRLVGSPQDAEDLLQDVFVKAFKNIASYDTERKFSSWIYRIAHNEAVNHIKRKSLKRFVPWENITATKDKLEMRSSEEAADNAWIRKEAGEEVGQAIDRLPFRYKQVLVLRYYSDKSYEEISEILDKPINTVGTLINRAKKKIATELRNSKGGNYLTN
jgi:RNA polymerase sigma-70 factor, ECF subfamily